MKAFALALTVAMFIGSCRGDADNDRAGNDTALGDRDTMLMSMNGDSAMGHDMMGGDMTEHMSQMNETMRQSLGESDSAFEQRFIDRMVPHHQGAIMMAEDALQKAVHPELKEFARTVIDEQRREIADLKMWRQEWYGDSAIAVMEASGMPMSMEEMDRRMMDHLGAADSTYDDRFIDMMIPHHQGAVMMAEVAAEKATRGELKALAKQMISDQNKEIAQLETWRTEWFGH